MDNIQPQPVTELSPPRIVLGEWYLKGFADAYGAHWAVTPCGPAGIEYQKGYDLGIAAVRREYYAALWMACPPAPAQSEAAEL